MNARKLNHWFGIVIPAFEFLIFVYAAYVMTGEVAVNWLLNPPAGSGHAARPGAAIAILVIFYVLLLLALASLLRVLMVIYTDPGYIPTKSEQPRTGGGRRVDNYVRSNEDLELRELATTTRPYGSNPNLVEFYEMDAFVCTPNGWPVFCSRCQSFKPDRVHHSTDVGRCVRGYDHYCPWAGGIVSEANHKFFNLFIFYTALFCIHVTVCTAIFISEQHRAGLASGRTYLTMCVLLAFSAFFGLFTIPMTGVHFSYAFRNLTSVEELQLRNVTYLAVHIGRGPVEFPNVKSDIIHYPLEETQRMQTRSFAIIRVEPGTNIFDIGWWKNWCLTMGVYPWEWFLPIKASPQTWITKRYNMKLDYPIGDIEEYKQKWLAEKASELGQ